MILKNLPKRVPLFENLFRKLNEDERAPLRISLMGGIENNTFVVWRKPGILVEGHNRMEICIEEQIPIHENHIRYMDFGSEQEAVEWAIARQRGRRNLDPTMMAVLRGLKYADVIQPQGGDRRSKHSEGVLKPTRKEIAENEGVSVNKLDNDIKLAEAAKKVAEEDGTTPLEVAATMPKKEIEARAYVPPTPKKPKSKPIVKAPGDQIFDWTRFKRSLGEVIRAGEGVKEAYPKEVTQMELAAYKRLTKDVSDFWAALEKKLKKGYGS